MTTFTVTATNLEHSSVSTGSHLMAVAAELPNLNTLLADLPDDLEVVKIDRHQNAIEVITAALAKHPAQSLSIVAHGMPGQVLIGQRGIDRTSLIEQSANIRAWGVKTISLFSCQTGADAAFVEALSEFSGADVYASADAVGHEGLGASWTLRNQAGLEGAVPFSLEVQQRWQGRLAAFAVVAASSAELPPLPSGFDSYAVTIPNSVTSIANLAFFGVPVTSVTIPNSVTSIGSAAFQQTLLTSVTIPNSVTSIGSNAFYLAPVTSVTIPNSVTSIGSAAFQQTLLTSVTIPNSVTSIGDAAFSRTPLTSVTIGNSVTSIGSAAFQETLLTSVTIGNSVTSIGDAAFQQTFLTSVTIPNSVTSIGSNAFLRTPLTSVTIGNSVTSIGNAAFQQTLLASVTIPNSVTSIGSNAFSRTPLTSVTIGNSVTSIGNAAFQQTLLASVTIPNSVTSIGFEAFDRTPLTLVRLPQSPISIGAGAFPPGAVLSKNDASISGNASGAVTEDLAVVNGLLTVSGKLNITDNDAGQASFRSTVTAAPGTLGSLTIDASGNWTYSVNNSLSAVQALGAGQTKIETFTVSSFDTTNTQEITITINGAADNAPPTAVNFDTTTTAIDENSDTTNRIKVADITITDDALGTNNLSLSGTDAASFEIVGTTLYLKAGTTLDFETKPSYNVTVAADDPTVGTTPDATKNFTLNVNNINDEAPTAVTFDNAVTLLSENVDTSGRIKLADIIVTDDGLGTNNLSLSGTDAASFEIIDTRLFLRAGILLDFETKPVYNVTVNVDDPTLGGNPDASSTFTFNLEDAVDASPFLVINNNISGVGSLRWAIDNANRTAGTQTIEFAPSLIGQTIDLSGEILQIADSVNIDADIDNNSTADITIDAGFNSSIFSISANQTVTIEGMVLQNGLVMIPSGTGSDVGGIYNRGNLTLRNTTVSDNIGQSGGGIYNDGVNSVLTLLNSTVLNNSTTDRGGGIYNNGGQVTITNSRVENNFANLGGGGFYNNGGSMIITNSTIGNNSSNLGGGLMNENGTVTLNNSTLLNNRATDTISGAINNQGSVLGAVVTLNGSTVSGGVYVNTINSGSLVVEGTNSSETLQGSSGVDRISGLGGDDLLQGFQGSDTLVGGDGNDIVNGGDNNDLLQGGAGNDRLGGLGGTDRMEGGTGNDVYTVNNAAATLVEAVGEGSDTVRSEISWSLGSNFENLTLLGTGNLNGTGNDINNALTGNSSSNSLEGQSGNDRLIGNGGDDVLIGGAGADTSTGGNGNDRFVFNAIAEGGDRITDFAANSDQIEVSAAGFGAGLSLGALSNSQFAIGSLTTTDQRFLYDTSTGALFFDSNGNGAGGRTRIATLTTKPILSASDIAIGA